MRPPTVPCDNPTGEALLRKTTKFFIDVYLKNESKDRHRFWIRYEQKRGLSKTVGLVLVHGVIISHRLDESVSYSGFNKCEDMRPTV